MTSHKSYRADYAVVGSGVAGLRAAIELSQSGSVLVLAKSDLSDSATAWAQGGIAVALSDEDEIGLHEQDTLKAGDGLCRADAVALLVEEGPKYITELIEWGTEFDRAGTKLAFTREAAHSRSRILHAHGIRQLVDIRTIRSRGTILSSIEKACPEVCRQRVSSTGTCPDWADCESRAAIPSIPGGATLLFAGSRITCRLPNFMKTCKS